MRSAIPTLLLLLLCFSCSQPKDEKDLYTGDRFNQNIRDTDPRTPQEELAGFKLPPGFEIELFASEPNIDKPMNLAFDAQGRMWVTQSFEYPFPAAQGKPHTDKLTIVEDTDRDGKADKFTVVSDTLDIPIGVLPTVDGAIGFSIPNIYKFTDSNADGKIESTKFLFGRFGYLDTHGMVSNFMRGYDGWVHACHGFTNFSKIAGSDGDSIKMTSGNTFRFKMDGSRVEQMTFGQVNPFGLAYDESGYIYSTDSHTSPLHQLIRGADYPHFSKPEIMAFGPDMKSFENEATALAGIAYYCDTQFPKEYQRNFFVGDPFLSKVHRYSWVNNGSSPKGKAEDDFVKNSDPWFRPVNVKLGPDGAIYIADFYNAIIGHYEVPLGHPKRDKQRGRIWRITYKGQKNEVKDLSKASVDELIASLNVDNIVSRFIATDQLTDRVGTDAVPALQSAIKTAGISDRKYVHSLWALYRLNAMSDELMRMALAHKSGLIRLHALRVLREWKPGAEDFKENVMSSLNDMDPHVSRMAVELAMKYPQLSSVENILEMVRTVPAEDNHLLYTAKLSVRNLLRNENVMKEARTKKWTPTQSDFIARTLVDVNSVDAALFLVDYLKAGNMPKEKTQLAYQQIFKFIPESLMASVVQQASEKKYDDATLQANVFRGINDGLSQRGYTKKIATMNAWASRVAESLLKAYPANAPRKTDEENAALSYGIQLIGDYNIVTLSKSLDEYFQSNKTDSEIKTSALRTKLKLSTDKSGFVLAETLLSSDTVSNDLKKRVATMLGDFPGESANTVLLSVKKAPADLEAAIAASLAGSSAGKDIVFKQVKSGTYMTRTLTDPRVEEKLLMKISPAQQKEYDALIANIDPINADRQKLIDDRIAAFKKFKPTTVQIDSGQEVFYKNCNVCHRKLVQSGIGPQLHGIGKRGAEAIAEKILDPNRNISEAFRNYTIKMKDGRVLTGLYRREEGALVVFGDLNGKEFSLPKKDIAEQKPSRYTIMPDHFGTTLSQHEFDLLVNYLLTW